MVPQVTVTSASQGIVFCTLAEWTASHIVVRLLSSISSTFSGQISVECTIRSTDKIQ